MSNRWKNNKNRRRILNLWANDPRCYYCHQPTVIILRPPSIGTKEIPHLDNEATLEHLRSRFNPERGSNYEENTVLACNKCNHTLGREEEASQEIEELRRRSANHLKKKTKIMSNIDEHKISINEYQVSNLIGLMVRCKDCDNGDWYTELLHKLHAFLITQPESNVPTFSNNYNDNIPRGEREFWEWTKDTFNRGEDS